MFELRTLSPIHIWSGDDISPLEYVVDGNYFYRVDLEKIFSEPKNREEFIKFVESKKRYFGDFNKDLGKENFRYKLEAHFTPGNMIKEFIKTSDRFYIPGSSVKGSILSAIYWHVLWERAEDDDIWDLVAACLRGSPLDGFKGKEKCRKYISRGKNAHMETLENIVFDFIGMNEKDPKFSQWLQVSDSTTTEKGFVGECEVYGSRMESIPMELLKRGTTLKLDIKEQRSRFSLDKILEITNEYYEYVYGDETDWCEEKGVEISDVKHTGKLIRIGQGSSSFSTSLLTLAKDFENEGEKDIVKDYINRWIKRGYRDGIFPRTKKFVVLDKRYSMGWAEIIEG